MVLVAEAALTQVPRLALMAVPTQVVEQVVPEEILMLVAQAAQAS
jgi:hypothetical protein